MPFTKNKITTFNAKFNQQAGYNISPTTDNNIFKYFGGYYSQVEKLF